DLSPDGNTLFVANNLSDNLGVISDLRDARRISRLPLQRPTSTQLVYPYDVQSLPAKDGNTVEKIYISLWGDGSSAVVYAKTMKQIPWRSSASNPKSRKKSVRKTNRAAKFPGLSRPEITLRQ